ncbi:MAG: aldehyde dehydrogenase family protein [Pseudomonadota bacterium]
MDFLKELGIKEINSGAYSDGWHETNGDMLVSVSPVDGKEIAKVKMATEADYDKVMANLNNGFKEFRKIPAPKRGEIVRQMGMVLREKKKALGQLVSYEMGKIIAEGEGEVQEMIDMADFAVGLSRQLYGLTMSSERQEHVIREMWHPLGVVGVITAFNFPVAVWAWNAFIAAVCGDPVIWKPSSKTPLTAIAVQNIITDVLEKNNVPPIMGMVIGRGSTIGEKMIADKNIPLISATGSCKMGKRIGAVVGARLGKTILELGGNNALLVSDSANLDMALRATVFGSVGTAGQRCTTTRRLILHKSVYDKFSKSLLAAYEQVKIGSPLDPSTLMGPLVDKSAVNDMMNALELVKKQGGEILCGGRILESDKFSSGCYVEPTIVKAKNDMEIVQEETFAPILYLIEAADMDEAINIQNDVVQGLSSSMFTTNFCEAEKFVSYAGSDCGIANINTGTSGAEIGGAFGGEKETGGGRESGSDAWKFYMRRQTCSVNFGKELPLAQGIDFNIS